MYCWIWACRQFILTVFDNNVCRSDSQRAQYLLLCLYLPLRFRDDQYVSSRNSSGKIEFRQVRVEHAGQYQCKMTNPQGGFVVSDTVSLTVGML